MPKPAPAHKNQAMPVLLCLCISLWISGCRSTPPTPPKPPCIALSHDTTLVLDTCRVDVKLPSVKIRGDILLLQGWNFPRTDWCEHSGFCRKALEKGYRLIMPETGKTVYHSRRYPETRPDWLAYPTGTYLWDTLIPYLQDHHCLLSGEVPAYVAGISTGGRGAALACLNLPHVFSAGAALSGDFDQRKMPADNLMTGYYGVYDSFPSRWDWEDNPEARVKSWSKPFYIAHGLADTIVPPNQSIGFFQAIQRKHPELQVELHTDSLSGHDYTFWDAQSDSLLLFFERHAAKP